MMTLVILSAITLTLIFWIKPPFLNRWVENNINKKLQIASQGLYHFDYSSIKIDLATQSIHVVDFTIYSDSYDDPNNFSKYKLLAQDSLPPVIVNFKAKEVAAEGMSIFSLLLFNTIAISEIKINEPVVHLNLTGTGADKTLSSPNKSLYDEFRKSAVQVTKSIQIDKINIKSGNMIVVDRRKKTELQAGLYNFNVVLNDILINKKNIVNDTSILGAQTLQLSAQKLELPSRSELYTFTIDSLQIDSKDSSLKVNHIHYRPLYSKKEFHQKTGKANERIDLSFHNIESKGTDIKALVNHQELKIKHLTINEGLMDFYKNKMYPKPKKNFLGKYPHELLQKSGMKITVDSIALKNILVSYSEKNPNTEKVGTINFEKTQGTITNLTNDTLLIQKNPLCKVDVVSRFMDKGALNAYFRFPLNTTNGSFSCGGKMKNFNMVYMNEVINALTFAGIQSGVASNLDFEIHASGHQANITMEMEYNDLKINLYKQKKGSDQLKKRTLLMKLINGIVIHQDNPRKDHPARIGKASLERESDQSFFNLIWTTIQQPVIRIVTGKDDVEK